MLDSYFTSSGKDGRAPKSEEKLIIIYANSSSAFHYENDNVLKPHSWNESLIENYKNENDSFPINRTSNAEETHNSSDVKPISFEKELHEISEGEETVDPSENNVSKINDSISSQFYEYYLTTETTLYDEFLDALGDETIDNDFYESGGESNQLSSPETYNYTEETSTEPEPSIQSWLDLNEKTTDKDEEPSTIPTIVHLTDISEYINEYTSTSPINEARNGLADSTTVINTDVQSATKSYEDDIFTSSTIVEMNKQSDEEMIPYVIEKSEHETNLNNNISEIHPGLGFTTTPAGIINYEDTEKHSWPTNERIYKEKTRHINDFKQFTEPKAKPRPFTVAQHIRDLNLPRYHSHYDDYPRENDVPVDKVDIKKLHGETEHDDDFKIQINGYDGDEKELTFMSAVTNIGENIALLHHRSFRPELQQDDHYENAHSYNQNEDRINDDKYQSYDSRNSQSRMDSGHYDTLDYEFGTTTTSSPAPEYYATR